MYGVFDFLGIGLDFCLRVHWQQAQMHHQATIATCDLLLSLLSVTTATTSALEREGRSGTSDRLCSDFSGAAFSDIMSAGGTRAHSSPSVDTSTTTFQLQSSNANDASSSAAPAADDVQSSPSNVLATTLVVMQWKSHACMKRMSQLLHTAPRAGSEDAAKVTALADESIGLALECALSHYSTRTLLLAFNAVMVSQLVSNMHGPCGILKPLFTSSFWQIPRHVLTPLFVLET
jgi:hypothetical protein